ncbi:unnamed protein product [Prunus armeniaca]|uniref:Uncharacterized protein n=1 Tax=Prunus armeniaca TaxID=36596 RepID=A0A6J5X701_PRUAR|nr:unnamed protein product [Prunus armeniaca]CAB4307775.1 unnamed protein product [Prunus armeniaca]
MGRIISNSSRTQYVILQMLGQNRPKNWRAENGEGRKLKVERCYYFLGIGGAERLIVDVAVELVSHEVHHDKNGDPIKAHGTFQVVLVCVL